MNRRIVFYWVGRIVLLEAGLLLLPLFAVCAVGALLIWLPQLILVSRMKDKAWTHTVRYLLHLVFPILWPFAIGHERMLKFYRNLIEDFRK